MRAGIFSSIDTMDMYLGNDTARNEGWKELTTLEHYNSTSKDGLTAQVTNIDKGVELKDFVNTNYNNAKTVSKFETFIGHSNDNTVKVPIWDDDRHSTPPLQFAKLETLINDTVAWIGTLGVDYDVRDVIGIRVGDPFLNESDVIPAHTAYTALGLNTDTLSRVTDVDSIKITRRSSTLKKVQYINYKSPFTNKVRLKEEFFGVHVQTADYKGIDTTAKDRNYQIGRLHFDITINGAPVGDTDYYNKIRAKKEWYHNSEVYLESSTFTSRDTEYVNWANTLAVTPLGNTTVDLSKSYLHDNYRMHTFYDTPIPSDYVSETVVIQPTDTIYQCIAVLAQTPMLEVAYNTADTWKAYDKNDDELKDDTGATKKFTSFLDASLATGAVYIRPFTLQNRGDFKLENLHGFKCRLLRMLAIITRKKRSLPSDKAQSYHVIAKYFGLDETLNKLQFGGDLDSFQTQIRVPATRRNQEFLEHWFEPNYTLKPSGMTKDDYYIQEFNKMFPTETKRYYQDYLDKMEQQGLLDTIKDGIYETKGEFSIRPMFNETVSGTTYHFGSLENSVTETNGSDVIKYTDIKTFCVTQLWLDSLPAATLKATFQLGFYLHTNYDSDHRVADTIFYLAKFGVGILLALATGGASALSVYGAIYQIINLNMLILELQVVHGDLDKLDLIAFGKLAKGLGRLSKATGILQAGKFTDGWSLLDTSIKLASLGTIILDEKKTQEDIAEGKRIVEETKELNDKISELNGFSADEFASGFRFNYNEVYTAHITNGSDKKPFTFEYDFS